MVGLADADVRGLLHAARLRRGPRHRRRAHLHPRPEPRAGGRCRRSGPTGGPRRSRAWAAPPPARTGRADPDPCGLPLSVARPRGLDSVGLVVRAARRVGTAGLRPTDRDPAWNPHRSGRTDHRDTTQEYTHDPADRAAGPHLADPGGLRRADRRAGGHEGSAPRRTSSPGSAPPATRATSARTAATTPPARSRASSRARSASSSTCSSTPTPTVPADDGVVARRQGRDLQVRGRRRRRGRDVPARRPRERGVRRGLTVYSPQAPLGAALLGAESGSVVEFTGPNGRTNKVDGRRSGRRRTRGLQPEPRLTR